MKENNGVQHHVFKIAEKVSLITEPDLEEEFIATLVFSTSESLFFTKISNFRSINQRFVLRVGGRLEIPRSRIQSRKPIRNSNPS
jgi:hypothetical protein